MSNLIETVFTFCIVIVAGFIALTVLTNTNNIAIGNCAYNATGTLVNCSQSNSGYQMINQTGQQYGIIFGSIAPPLTWVLGAGVILALFVGLFALFKK